MATTPDVPLVVPVSGASLMDRTVVGGKGHALIRLAEAGFPVPPGAVLTTAFFAPWFDEICASSRWADLTEADPGGWAPLCDALKDRCSSLPFSATQNRALDALRDQLDTKGGGEELFAVRSSSPEEDLESASFAGGYETRLGVPSEDLKDAIRHCFASSLDERVLVYKREQGLDPFAPQIAVVVQEQIDSDVAGVGFSLNPVTNDYDEAVIDANWGLGTTVVEGRVSPDHFVINKVDRSIVEATTGEKSVAMQVNADGGVRERMPPRTGDRTLSDEQLHELTAVLCRVERLYDRPMDVEWAYADGTLHVLQARPITAYVPLHPSLQTEPGERRRLYADPGLAKGAAINAPISPMGQAAIEALGTHVAEWFVGRLPPDLAPEESLLLTAPGRSYQNLSALLSVVSPERLATGFEESDSRIAEVLRAVDADRYRLSERPSWARPRTLLSLLPRLVGRVGQMLVSMLWVLLAPDRAWTAYRQTVDAVEARLTEELDWDLPLTEFRRRSLGPSVRHFLEVTGPAFGASFLAMQSLDRVVGAASGAEALTDTLRRGFRGNVVTEMGIALHRMAQHLEPAHFEDLSRLAERIEARALPDAFLRDWDRFLERWGCRGPNEMDVARPRYADEPTLALRQMSYMATGEDDFDPAAAQERLVAERRQAYEVLTERLGGVRRALLRRLYRVIERFGGTRDTPKHHLILALDAVRTRVLMEGERLADAGRLDAPQDVFGLTFDDLAAAAEDPSLDLQARCDERMRFVRRLEEQVTSFPPVIDSRGRILRPPSPETDDGLRGLGVSPGVATGPVKVLHSADEKPVDKGDVLVAATTDPGWTPLFVNAAALVLEVGGTLQHGAVVAREYGKPCVVGLDRATERLEDGQRVEVDGGAGTVRLLSE
jgi:pyruvate,water dikinase